MTCSPWVFCFALGEHPARELPLAAAANLYVVYQTESSHESYGVLAFSSVTAAVAAVVYYGYWGLIGFDWV
jgi:hypothetical protein